MYKIQYLIITQLPGGFTDLSYYDTKEEALEDFDPNNDWFQELFEVKKIL